MSLPSNFYKQPQPQQQQQQATARRLRNATAHDAAALLFDEMSHAAARTSRSTSPELPAPSPPPNTLLSPLVPAVSTARSLNAAASGVSSQSNSLSVSNAHAAAFANPLFYVRPLSAMKGPRVAGQHSINSASLANSHHASTITTSNANNINSSGGSSAAATAAALAEAEGGNVGVGRNTPASATTAVPPQPTTAGNPSNSAMNSLSTPPSSIRGASLPPVPPPTAAAGASATANATPVYIRHTSASMSAAAPWLRLHRFGGNAGSTAVATANGNGGGVAGMGPGSPGLSAAGSRKTSGTISGPLGGAAAPVAAASGVGTPKMANPLSSSTPAIPGTPLTSVELGHNASSEDEAALICQLCQSLNCVCGRGGGTGESGFTNLSAYGSCGNCVSCDSGGGGGASCSAALALHKTQQLLHRAASSTAAAAAAVEAVVPLSLVPPFRTARVESGVYRGAYPVLRNFPYLRRLRLRTIVSLIPEAPTYDLKCFAEAEHIQLHHIHAERAKGEVQLLPSELSEALQLLMNADLHPLYLHCLDGRHVAGLVVMGLRKLQQWDVQAAHAEYLRFTGEEQDEVSFITDYTGPLLVPPHLPAWLWGGSLYDPATGQPKKLQPSSMRLRLTTAVTGGVASPAGMDANASLPAVAASSDGLLRESSGLLTTRSASSANPAAYSANNNYGGGGGAGTGSGDARLHATAPWMSVPQVEVIASDGQLYVDVDRVRGAAALYSNASAGYRNEPMLFSFEYAAAKNSSSGGAGAAAIGGTAGAVTAHNSVRRGHKSSSPSTSAAAATTQIPGDRKTKHKSNHNSNRGSRHSSQSSSANGSIAGPPAAAAAVLAAAAGSCGSATSTRSSSPSSKWTIATPFDVLQPPPSPYRMQPPSPNSIATTSAAALTASTVATAASSAAAAGGTAAPPPPQRGSPAPSNSSNDGVSSSNLFDTQLSALMWTSGLTTPPAGSSPRQNTVAASGATVATAANSIRGGSSGVGGSSPGTGGGGASGTGGGSVGSAAAAAAAAAPSGSRRAAGTSGNATGTSATSRATKRSFSR